MKKLLSLVFVCVLVLTGCGKSAAAYEFDGACDGDDAKIGLVTDTGGVHDKSFNQGTWEGMEKYCHDNDIAGSFIETTEESQREANLTKMSETDGIEVVVASGFTFANDLYNVAKDHPDVDYILIDAEPADADGNAMKLDNVISYYFQEEQAGYLVGYVAGKVTESNRVGFIGGEEIPPVQKFGWGFVQGVNAANPSATVDYNYTGQFGDPALGKTTAQTMIANGSDVIFASAGGTGDGVITAGIESTKTDNPCWIIGVDSDQYDDGAYKDADGKDASIILTSAMKLVNNAAYEGITRHFAGEFKSDVVTLGFDDDGVGLPEENPNLDDEIKQEALDALA
ncbi:MAG: BMP family protein, partial [Mycoplasmatales bacterium]